MTLRSSAVRIAVIVSFVVAAAAADARAAAEQVTRLRLTDRGPFEIWNGVDADAPASSGQRVLAVVGATKSLRVNYNAAMAAPRVATGPGWADVVAGPGTAMTFSGPDRDCYYNRILFCSNRPIDGYPAGTILCVCTKQDGTICCTSDTGFYSGSMIPREEGY